MRIYQFQHLMTQHLPEIAKHLEALNVEPLYVSQWFLSFFAVTCPLPMLLRIYDVILSEGATETLMRVALSLMKRNQDIILSNDEFEDVMQFLLSRALWDTYAQQPDELVTDFAPLTTVVNRESLTALEASFADSKGHTLMPSLKNAASQLLGRFWAGSGHTPSKSANSVAMPLPSPSRRASHVHRTASKQSLSSTLNSYEAPSDTSTVATEVSLVSRKSDLTQVDTNHPERATGGSKERDLENQIEDLLKAMSDMQQQQTSLMSQLQREREERQEDRDMSRALLLSLKSLTADLRELSDGDLTEQEQSTETLVAEACVRFPVCDNKRVSIMESKHQLRDEVSEWKTRHDQETARCQQLIKQLNERDQEQSSLRDQLRDARTRVQDTHKEKQRMERTIQDLRCQRSPTSDSPNEMTTSPIAEIRDSKSSSAAATGLREFKLGRMDALKNNHNSSNPPFSKRSSSLQMPVPSPIVETHNQQHQQPQQPPCSTAAEETLLLDLVQAKTSEAVARQELEEVKGKLDALKKLLGGLDTPSPSPVGGISRATTTSITDSSSHTSQASIDVKPSPAASTPTPKSGTSGLTGGFFSGWGKRAAAAPTTTSPA
jgi:predicted  nucleic acid-binding Zn-ribbon protein